MIRIGRRTLLWLVAAVVAVAAVAGIMFAASVYAPTTIATAGEIDAQRVATERAIQRIYVTGVDQLKTTRSLKLAIADAQAGAIEQKYTDQLKALRRSALQAIGDAYGGTADQSAQYAAQAEPRLEAAPAASAAPVLLAPRLYAIVERMGTVTSQLTEQGIKEMTQTAPSSPAPSPSPSSTPRPPGAASPSPTGR